LLSCGYPAERFNQLDDQCRSPCLPLFSWMLLGERISGETILGVIFVGAGITISAPFEIFQ